MKTLIIVGNWKANKTIAEAKEWLKEMANGSPKAEQIANGLDVVVCAPYINLPILKEQLVIQQSNNLTIHLGSQDISQFEDGPYTGEVTGRMLENLVEYVIIGHSERRKYFQETDDVLKMKVEKALRFDLKPIYCISEEKTLIPQEVEIVAYEPLFAIGSGHPDTPENADLVASEIKKHHQVKVLYGGSVKPENARSFAQQPNIDGLLVGGASLPALDFIQVIKNVS